MSEALPNDSEESEKKPEETPGDTTPNSGSPEIKPEVPLSDQIDQIQGAYYELLGQSFYIVWKTAEPGIIAVAGLGLSYIVINFIIKALSGARGSRYGRTKVDFFPAGPDSIIVNR